MKIKEYLNRFSWILIPFVCFILLNQMILFNKGPIAYDTVSHKPIANWTKDYAENNSDNAFWYPHLFSGMPAFGSHIVTPGNPLNGIMNFFLFNRGLKYWFYFSIGGLGLFVFLRERKNSQIASLFGGLVFSLTPYMFGLINAGHSSKILALSISPWVFLAADYLILKHKMRGIPILAIVSAWQLWANHPQIVYYLWMVVTLWWILNQANALLKKQWSIGKEGKSTLLILVGLILSLLIVSTPYSFIYEFQKHSNRGAPSVLDITDETESGVKWDYATQWSFHPKELISFLYPYYYGMQNYPTRDIKSAAYWGGMPFTQSTHYFGILVVLISILGALLKKPDRFLAFLWVTTGLIILIGFGNYFPIIFAPLFKFAPFFRKFRIPSMIYALLPFTFGILAAYGLENNLSLIKKGTKVDKKITNKVLLVFGSFIVLTLFYILFGNSVIAFLKPTEAGQYDIRVIGQIKNMRQELFQKGVLLALVISGGGFAAVWFGLKQKLKPLVVGSIIIALTVVDLWVVDQEFLYLEESKQMDNQFKSNAITDYLKADKEHFRIFPADELNSNWYGYFGLASVGGYRPVKLRTYQDLMDAGGLNNLSVLSMLNVKYLITTNNISHPKMIVALDGQKKIYQNLDALPKAWLVNRIINVSTQKESLEKTLSRDFKPSTAAIVVDYKGKELNTDGNGIVSVEKYSENQITLNVDSKNGGLLILSENYYKPGWKAFIGGLEATIYQTNHILRSVYVPSGNHSVNFIYDDQKWQIVRIISRFSFLITILLLIIIYRKKIISLVT